MSQTLYRTYRPKTFAEITGQNHVTETLQNEIINGKIAHAYLFCGPRGVGKTTAARLLARTINCEQRNEGRAEPCNTCAACTEQMQGADLDIVEIDAASHTGVDNVRENIIESARFTPLKRRYKVFIIDEVHMLSISAFNALLKLLEEPPAHVLFILATTEVHKIPATIISRCQRFDFKKVALPLIIERLQSILDQEHVQVEERVLRTIGKMSEGCLRDAESLLGQVLSLGDKKITFDDAQLVLPVTDTAAALRLYAALAERNAAEGVAVIQSLVDDGVQLTQFTADFIELLRKALVFKITGIVTEPDDEVTASLYTTTQSVSTTDLVRLITIFIQKKNQIKESPIAQLPLELAVVEFCGDDSGGTPPPQSGGEEPAQKSSTRQKSVSPPSGSSRVAAQQSSVSQEPVGLPASSGSQVSVTVEDIKKRWNEFLVALQDLNASLTFILKVAEPLSIEGNALKVGLQYAFHQKRLMDPKMKQAVEEGLFLVFKERMICCPTLLPKEYVSTFIAEHTKDDEVEFVQEVSKEQARQLVEEQDATVLQTESASGEESETQNALANELVEKLVEAFGGKLVE